MAMASASHVLQQTTALLIILFMFSAAAVTTATSYIVGGSQGWNAKVDYTAWTHGKEFVVGDTLLFNYNSLAHNVLRVSQRSYNHCINKRPMATYATGQDAITLNKAGTSFFICGLSDHCSAFNLKLKVKVCPRK